MTSICPKNLKVWWYDGFHTLDKWNFKALKRWMKMKTSGRAVTGSKNADGPTLI